MSDLKPVKQRREAWGMATQSVCQVLYPASNQDILDAYALAKNQGWTIGCWGNGRSYGDVALNEGNLVLDFSRMNTILDWDPSTGLVVCEPGVRLEQLWRHCLKSGYWPPVVSGTMHTTIGGLVAANAHGKNNWKVGTIGEHVECLTLVTPSGEVLELDEGDDTGLFEACIGGFGWLGAFSKITLRMKKVHSGSLDVMPFSSNSLREMFSDFERCNAAGWDYVVGWIDAFATGRMLGRGQIHAARYFEPNQDPDAQRTLEPSVHDLPDTFLGVVPKRILWQLMKPFSNRLGMRLINWVRFMWMTLERNHHHHPQPLARFNFLLDYVPNWKWIYKPGGLIQFQLFIPKETAREVFAQALRRTQQAKLEPWLVVMKRHRGDRFLLSHALDGYSLAMDFPVRSHQREALWKLCQELIGIVVEHGGRFYFAKDSVTSGAAVKATLGENTLARFFDLKKRVDPETLIQTNLYRRVFGHKDQESS